MQNLLEPIEVVGFAVNEEELDRMEKYNCYGILMQLKDGLVYDVSLDTEKESKKPVKIPEQIFYHFYHEDPDFPELGYDCSEGIYTLTAIEYVKDQLIRMNAENIQLFDYSTSQVKALVRTLEYLIENRYGLAS